MLEQQDNKIGGLDMGRNKNKKKPHFMEYYGYWIIFAISYTILVKVIDEVPAFFLAFAAGLLIMQLILFILRKS